MATRYGVEVTGKCRICGKRGKTEMHHIISQAMSDKIGKEELKTNPGNIVELCVPCHKLTSSHLFRKWIEKNNIDPKNPVRKRQTKRRKKAYRMANPGKFRCNGTKKNGKSCRNRVETEDAYCKYHTDQAPTESVDERELWELDEEELDTLMLEAWIASLDLED